jgi:cobaltochelatase CobN
MVETIRKDYWKADEATQKKLLEEFMTSVKEHGIGCSGNTCGNPRLMQYMTERAKALGVPTPLIDTMQKAVEKATGQQISEAARKVEEFVRANEAAPREISQQTAPAPLEGYKMEVQHRDSTPKPASSTSSPNEWQGLMVSVPLLAILLYWRSRHRAA